MRLIVRADDFGYCEAINRGIIDCIRYGIVTTVELMVDMPGTEQAVAMIQEFPEISVALHCHYQGKACAPKEKIPSLVDEEGNLIIRQKKKMIKGYRPDLHEMFIEYKAQVQRFFDLMGRYPDYIKPIGPNASHMKELAAQLDIPCDYRGGYELGKLMQPDPKWEYLDYFTVPVLLTKEHDKVENQAKLDSIGYFLKDEAGILSSGHQVVEIVMHPGWIDEFVLQNSSYTIIRLNDVIALKSEKVKKWIKENKIELASAYDILHNTRNYQSYMMKSAIIS